MTQLKQLTRQPAVLVTQDEVLLNGFVERDSVVVDVVFASDEQETAVHRLLELGARVTTLAETTLDVALVESTFANLAGELDETVDAAASRISDAAAGLLDEEGSLPKALGAFRDDLHGFIEATFDPDSRASAVSRLDQVLTESGERLVLAVRNLLDPDADGGPMARYRTEMAREIRESGEATLRAVQELSERVAVRKAEADLIELGTAKGFSFEELVHESLLAVVGPFSDVAESVGTTLGATGGKVGDEVVTLCTDDTQGRESRYVIECKDRRMSSTKAILDEVGEAMANRQALAGIAVFSSQDNAPTSAPFQTFGDKAIVVFDKADPDERALALACAWARWVVRREATDGVSAIDLERVGAALDEGRRALARVANVRRAHSIATKKIAEAASQVDDLADDLDRALERIADELRTGCEGSASTAVDS